MITSFTYPMQISNAVSCDRNPAFGEWKCMEGKG